MHFSLMFDRLPQYREDEDQVDADCYDATEDHILDPPP